MKGEDVKEKEKMGGRPQVSEYGVPDERRRCGKIE